MLRDTNLHDILALFRDNSYRVAANIDQNMSFANPDVYFIFTNGCGECLAYINSTQELYNENLIILLSGLEINLYYAVISLVIACQPGIIMVI